MAEIWLEPVKRGDAFTWPFILKDESGVVITGAASKLKSQVRSNVTDTLWEDLTIVETGTPGTYMISALRTSDWPIETLIMDIEYTPAPGELPSSSDTINIPVIKDVTHGY